MEELNGYAPPVSFNPNDFQYEIGDAVVRAIAKFGIQVNQEELLKALKYDRGQYKAGYDAGFADGFVETLHIARCRECTHYNGHRHCDYFCETVLDDDFCSYGKRKEKNNA